jgi:hypothetical protein
VLVDIEDLCMNFFVWSCSPVRLKKLLWPGFRKVPGQTRPYGKVKVQWQAPVAVAGEVNELDVEMEGEFLTRIPS